MRIASLTFFFRLTMTAALASSLLATSCASRTHSGSPTPAPIERRFVGQVAIVDAEQGFVLIDLGSNLYVPEPGVLLRASNDGGETAQLKTTPEQKRPFVAADIVEGHPLVGDQVFR
ncbi:MAG: hypothetical protein ACR2MW_11315 [Chthoniobacterales bacterium]